MPEKAWSVCSASCLDLHQAHIYHATICSAYPAWASHGGQAAVSCSLPLDHRELLTTAWPPWAAHYRLPYVSCSLPLVLCELLTAVLPSVSCSLPLSLCEQLTAACPLWAAHCRLLYVSSSLPLVLCELWAAAYSMWAAHCRLFSVSCRLLYVSSSLPLVLTRDCLLSSLSCSLPLGLRELLTAACSARAAHCYALICTAKPNTNLRPSGHGWG